ncbi:hypothetical protein A0256_08270 [Mucilaginibacter sp. PAMC 26640]|nr:hypothetical protein A0256_08270 [Mucilaginibacter sp. PAMC 26640]
MFEKLFLLVKNNAQEAVINNPSIAVNYQEAVMNDASSSIIEVLKGQMETGKFKELVKYFQFAGIYNNPLIAAAVKKFAVKLENYYGMDSAIALKTSNQLIPPVMQEMIKQSKNEPTKEFALDKLLSKLSGNMANMTLLLTQIKVA